MSALFVGIQCATALGDIIYVDANAAPGGDGTTWGTAYKYLQDAFYKPPVSGDDIWVASGTYKPDQDEGSNVTVGDRMATFELIDGVSIYGGFPIDGGTWEERDPNLNETILSGDLNGDDGADFANNGENSYNVAHISWASGTTILNGFTVTSGNANVSGARTAFGGGINDDGGGDITIANCIFVQNWALGGGGVLIVFSNNSQFLNCTFVNNKTSFTADGYGGGIYLYEVNNINIKSCKFLDNYGAGGGGVGLFYSSPTLINCSFLENTSFSVGGAIYCYSFGGWPETEKYSNPTIINSEFIGNSSDYDGGAIYFRGECHSSLTNCSLAGNSAIYDGGAIYENGVFQTADTTLINCTLVRNTAGNKGGGIYSRLFSDSSLTNSIIWGNKDSTGINEVSQIKQSPSGNITVASSCIQDNDVNDGYIPFGGAANNNIDDNPNFVRDPNDGGDGWGVGGNDDYGDLRLSYTSPVIDAGDNSAVPQDTEDIDEDLNTAEPIPYDLDEHPRIVDGDCNDTDIVDMGAYEFQEIPGDFEPDGDVDANDLDFFTDHWLYTDCNDVNDWCEGTDLDHSHAVDFDDFAILAKYWQVGK